MIYISAVGMVNALGNSLDEIAANLTAGVAPGMHCRSGWLQDAPDAVLGGVKANCRPFRIPCPRTAPAITSCCWPRWHRFNPPLTTRLPGLAATAWPWFWVPAPPASMKGMSTYD